MAYDIVIKNGTIIDGSGKPRFEGDIGIQGVKIKEVGKIDEKGAKRVIEAFGLFVTPGFIDITNHSDSSGSLFDDPQQAACLTQGVTTILVGNCGVSLAPLASSEAIKAVGKWQDVSKMNINWASFGEFLDELSRHQFGVNVASLVGHNTLRRGVIGSEIRPLTIEELSEIQYLIEKSIGEGAFGLSTSLSNAHEQVATSDEIIAMAKVVSRFGGVYKTHLRNESRELLSSINEAILIGREARVPVIISHMKAIGRKSWPFFLQAIKMIENARKTDGVKISFDLFPYARTGSFLYFVLPSWAREGGFEEMFKRFRDLETRKKILDYLKPETFHFDKITIASAENKSLNGKTLEEIANVLNQPVEEIMLDIVLASHGKATILGRTLSFKNILLGIAAPFSIIASDGNSVSEEFIKSGKLAHPRGYGAFTHFLHRFVAEKGIATWEEGIKKITSLPAEAVGIKERGLIKSGYHADIAIFDPKTIHDHATYQSPFVTSKGVSWVIVNGVVAVENGAVTSVKNGNALRKA
ncbi:MAG: D-aminoacylase [bacterium]|nr:D-aminoacylase [bacterium]